jgi:beta-1,4-mannosyl-glycoprotein beta-1,4-N-acetylglucosaminyltransferase
MMPVVDCFPYFMEVELLEFRLRLLWDHVQHFIITEADHTFSGLPKPFTCAQQLATWGVPADRVTVVQVPLPPAHVSVSAWHRERMQRDAAQAHMQPDHVYIVSDCDEIINPDLIPLFVKGAHAHPDHIMRINLAWLMGRANLRVCCPQGIPAGFDHAFVCAHHHIQKHTLSQIREDHACQLHEIEFPSLYLQNEHMQKVECGWHMSWMGNAAQRKIKMRSYSHHADAQQGIFQTAVGAINSLEMQQYVDAYDPQVGGHDAYGRSDYYLQAYDTHELPALIHEMHHLKPYFFGHTT